MLNNTQIDKLANDLISQVDLSACLKTFEWDRQGLQLAWASRQALADGRFGDTVEQYAERVHKWGFGTSVRASVVQHEAYSSSMRALCQTWSDEVAPWSCPEAIESLVALLEIKYVGIARVSKFVCFIDQDRFAIYDSRVSYALKDLTLDGMQRVFPFVGGRPVKNARYVLADIMAAKPRHMTAVYVAFLCLLQRVAETLNQRGGVSDSTLQQAVGKQWTPALLEMALFMAGRQRLKTAAIRRLDTRLWDSLVASVASPASDRSAADTANIVAASST